MKVFPSKLPVELRDVLISTAKEYEARVTIINDYATLWYIHKK